MKQSRHFSIWIVSPSDYIHSRCFEETAIGLRAAFAQLGMDVPIVTNPAQIKDYAIVLGANLLPIMQIALPPHLILYNLEQVQDDSDWLTSGYVELLRRYPVWDYSERNIAALKKNAIDATLCGIGYMPELTDILPAMEDIDVLFVGSLNDRRKAVLAELVRQGANVTAAVNIYGKERDALIARAKLVLNMHYYEAQVFEIVRVSYLLANRKCVVSEVGRDDALEAPLRSGVAFVSYGDLPAACIRLLANKDERDRLADEGLTCFSALSQVSMLERALTTLTL